MQQPPGRPTSPPRPMPPYQGPGVPQRPAGPPQGPGAPHPGMPPGQPAPPGYAPAVAPLPVAARPPKKRVTLRLVAGVCVFSGWATLVLSILSGLGSIGMGVTAAGWAAAASRATTPYPSLPTTPGSGGQIGNLPALGDDEIPSLGGGAPGLPNLGGGGAAGLPGLGGGGAAGLPGLDLGEMLPRILAPMMYATGALTILTGITFCILFLGLGQACYAILDLEEQSHQISQTLQMIAARLGGR